MSFQSTMQLSPLYRCVNSLLNEYYFRIQINGNTSDNNSDGQEMESPAKKLKSKDTAFTAKKSSDDICLQFDDGEKLYVPPGFLFLISPVFKAMFDHDCVEKRTKTIKLREKNYDDFLEFLMCLHPARQHLVNQLNVLRLVRLANEYKVPRIISKCKAVMRNWLPKCAEHAKKQIIVSDEALKMLKNCLTILKVADELNYLEVRTTAITTVARFGIGLYTDQDLTNYYDVTDKQKELQKECTEMFDEMPDECKSMVFLARLKHFDKKNRMF